MKIGIITILKVNNYGAELQAFATQAILKDLGYDAEIIDYLFYKNPNHKPTAKSRPIFKHSLRKRITEFVYPIISRFKEIADDCSKRKQTRFEAFHQQYTSTSPVYRTIEELYQNHKDYDVYITGSDQTWNPGIYSSLLPYFLDFAPEGKRRIAFAASFGISNLPDNVIEIYKYHLSKYSAIGVRERSGVEIVNELGINATNVLDPTLLLDTNKWRNISSKVDNLPERYLLVYELIPSAYLNTIVEIVANRLSLPIVRICNATAVESKNNVNIMDAGPSEFLHLFQHSAFIITNSFHGTAFSINFQKPFFVITPSRKNNNSRQKNLLSLVGLEDRILQEGDPGPSTLDLDFTDATKRLAAERDKSINFLNTAINGE